MDSILFLSLAKGTNAFSFSLYGYFNLILMVSNKSSSNFSYTSLAIKYASVYDLFHQWVI